MVGYAHEQKAHGDAVERLGQQKNTMFVILVGLTKIDLKHNEASLSKIFLCL